MSESLCVIIYDSECGLCTRFKKAVELIDFKNNIRFLSLHDSEVYLKYPELTPDECHEEVHLIKDSGAILKGSEAIDFLTTILPGVSKFAWLMDNESAKKASKIFYKKLNEMRIMKKRNCYTCGSSSKRTK